MNLLTWHGAVLRIDRLRNRLVQDPLWLTALDGNDFGWDRSNAMPTLPGLGGFRAMPGARPGIMRFANGFGCLTAPPNRREVSVEPDEGLGWQNFLAISAQDLADLRHILAHRWRMRPGNTWLEKSDIRLVAGFGLELGDVVLDLSQVLPLASVSRRPGQPAEAYEPPPSFVVQPGDAAAESLELADGAASLPPPGQHMELVERRHANLQAVNTGEAFLNGSQCELTLQAPHPLYLVPPLMLRSRDAAQFQQYLREQGAPQIGLVPESCTLKRERQRYVMMARACEGVVFNQDGTNSDLTGLVEALRLPPGVSRRAGSLWIDRAVLHEAPQAEGPLVVFYDHHMDGYRQFLTGALPALDMISRVSPRSARLLLPGHYTRMGPRGGAIDPAFDHREVMARLGYGQMPSVVSPADIVLADEVIYMDAPEPAHIPGPQLRDFRERVLMPFDGPGEPIRRLYLKYNEAGGIEPQHEIERFLAQEGFDHVQLDHLNFDAMLRMFREAAFVVAPSCGGLANILFSTPGLRVLEVMDDRGFTPETWQLCSKLGHVHGMIGAPVRHGRLNPDLARFKALFDAMDQYR